MDSIYSAIRNNRIQRGFSQEYMADKLGMNQSSYAKLERGGTQLTIERLYQIGQIFGMEPSELMGGGKNDVFDVDRSNKVRQLEERITELKEQLEDKRLIIKFLKDTRQSYLISIHELHDLYFDTRRAVKEKNPSLDPRKVFSYKHPYELYTPGEYVHPGYWKLMMKLEEEADKEFFAKYPTIGQMIDDGRITNDFLAFRWSMYKSETSRRTNDELNDLDPDKPENSLT